MSYITVPAEKVAAAAQDIIDHILRKRKARDEQAISKAMWRKKYRFFGPNLTEQEAIEYCKGFFGFPSFYAWGDLDRAEKLLILAKHGDPVNIDADDAQLLWG